SSAAWATTSPAATAPRATVAARCARPPRVEARRRRSAGFTGSGRRRGLPALATAPLGEEAALGDRSHLRLDLLEVLATEAGAEDPVGPGRVGEHDRDEHHRHDRHHLER